MTDARKLADAVWDENVELVEAIIAAGVDVNLADPPHWPPLHLAIEQGNAEIVRRLIAAGADVNRPFRDCGDDFTPLVHAIDLESDAASQKFNEPGHESTEITESLLAAGAVPTAKAFELAGWYQNGKALELLRQSTKDSYDRLDSVE